MLCPTHHRLLHEGGFRIDADPGGTGRPTFWSPLGVRIPEVPPRMCLDRRPLTPEGVPPAWEVDVPLALYLRALETIA